jgi:signal transduction histidine kinase
MTERARLIDAELHVESTVSAGCVIRLYVGEKTVVSSG